MRDQVIITGGAGFIGSALIQRIFNIKCSDIQPEVAKYEFTAADKGLFGLNHLNCFLKNGIHCWRISVSELCKVQSQHWDQVYAVIHLSGLSNDPLANFDLAANNKLNYLDTIEIARKCAENNVSKFIFASSASVYGMSDDKISTEESELNPNSNYAISKHKAEIGLKELQKEFLNFHPVILRKATICGLSPRMRFDLVVNTMVMSAIRFGRIELIGGGENWRPLVSINDVVKVYEEILMCDLDFYNQKLGGQIFNVVGQNWRISELGLRIGDYMKVPVVSRYDLGTDVRDYRMCGKKLNMTLNVNTYDGVLYSVRGIKDWIEKNKPDFDDPIYSNIKWIKACKRMSEIIGVEYDLCKI